MSQPYKVCPRCSQAAMLTISVCGRCGHHYRTQFAPASAAPVVNAPVARRSRPILLVAVIAFGIVALNVFGASFSHNQTGPSAFKTLAPENVNPDSQMAPQKPLVRLRWRADMPGIGLGAEIENISDRPLTGLVVEATYRVIDSRSGFLLGSHLETAKAGPLGQVDYLGSHYDPADGSIGPINRWRPDIQPGERAPFPILRVHQYNIESLSITENGKEIPYETSVEPY